MIERERIKAFLDGEGRLKAYPTKWKNKLLVLEYLWERFEAGLAYSEKEVNALLNTLHTFGDPATLRRELYDNLFLDRARDGSVYRRRERPET